MTSKYPNGILSPPARLWGRLARRIAEGKCEGTRASAGPADDWDEPDWREAVPGLWYQLLSCHPATGLVTMLMQLEAEMEYPPHLHADREELYLLDGELWINDRGLHPGDYSRAEAGTIDERVWSPTGCICVLITSLHDVLK